MRATCRHDRNPHARPRRLPADARPGVQESAVRAIEGGGVLVLPRIPLSTAAPSWSDGRAKNVSLDGDRLEGRARRGRGSGRPAGDDRALRGRCRGPGRRAVSALRAVRAARAHQLPAAACGRRNVSWRKDDSRLHVDAFRRRTRRAHPARVHELNPAEARLARRRAFERWRTLLPRIRAPLPGRRRSAALHVTKGAQRYDHLMLSLHDRAKGLVPAHCAQRSCVAPGTRGLLFGPGDARAVSGSTCSSRRSTCALSARRRS